MKMIELGFQEFPRNMCERHEVDIGLFFPKWYDAFAGDVRCANWYLRCKEWNRTCRPNHLWLNYWVFMCFPGN